MKLVVLSRADPFARRVGEALGPGDPTGIFVDGSRLRRITSDTYALERDSLHVHDEHLGHHLPPSLRCEIDAVVFPSVHRSETGRPTLTVHPVGNLSTKADLGGRPGTVSPVPARYLTEALLQLSTISQDFGIEATFEATHHGPYLDLPTLFLEAGSDPSVWDDPPLARAYARLLKDLRPHRTREDQVVIGVGGGHYAPHFSEIARRHRVSFGHILPRHALPEVTAGLMAHVVAATASVGGWMAAGTSLPSPVVLPPSLPRIRESGLPRRPAEEATYVSS
jgi:D-aminoacyl-tRNA deacylase